jgi:hypothetical protein
VKRGSAKKSEERSRATVYGYSVLPRTPPEKESWMREKGKKRWHEIIDPKEKHMVERLPLAVKLH